MLNVKNLISLLIGDKQQGFDIKYTRFYLKNFLTSF
ncbi:MAG: hypothetical protein K0S12_404 [Bacteroidetes bacterium]|nr:hypothetical protein [Bacteroidota bacterium]